MTVTLQEFNHSNTRSDLPNIKPGHVVKVYQKITETKGSGKKIETKERIQIFEGLIIGRKGGTGINATITVRKLSGGIGVERVFPLNAPTIEKIELTKITKARRAKLNYMRERIGKATRPKGELVKPEDNIPKEEMKEEVVTEKIEEDIKENKDSNSQDDSKKEEIVAEKIEEKQKEVIAEKTEK